MAGTRAGISAGDALAAAGGIDPELVLRYREFLDHCLGSPEWREPVLGPVPRGLILARRWPRAGAARSWRSRWNV